MDLAFNSLFNYCCYDGNIFHEQSVDNNSGAIYGRGKTHYGVHLIACNKRNKQPSKKTITRKNNIVFHQQKLPAPRSPNTLGDSQIKKNGDACRTF